MKLTVDSISTIGIVPNHKFVSKNLGAAIVVLAGSVLGHCCSAQLQSESVPTLNVKVQEVLIPVFAVTRQSDQYMSVQSEVVDLSPKDFHVYEDGKEAPISSVRLADANAWYIAENGLVRCGWIAPTTDAIWGSLDFPARILCGNPGGGRNFDVEHDFGPVKPGIHVYLVAFVPLRADSKPCHKLKVMVDRPKVLLNARPEYCNASSPGDPIAGSKLATQLATFLNSNRVPKLTVTGQASAFPGRENQGNVDIALALPSKALVPVWDNGGPSSPTYIFGLVFSERRNLVKEFSDPSPFAPGYTPFALGGFSKPPAPPVSEELLKQWTDARYERRLALPPGKYLIKVALTNGRDYGRVDLPLTVPAADPHRLAIGSIVLCKGSHRYEEGSEETKHLPAVDRPLMSQGVEYTPTGDTRFKPGEHLIPWLEIAVPEGQDAKAVKYRLRVSSVQDGKLQVDSGWQDASPYVAPGSQTIDIGAEFFGFAKLPPGEYRLDVQATGGDSATPATSSTTFTVVDP